MMSGMRQQPRLNYPGKTVGMNRNATAIILIIAIVCRFIYLIRSNRELYHVDYWQRYPELKRMYGESQYMMKKWKYWLPDETVYAYAAGAYVRGANPILVEPTQPPLGKYLIGLSVIVTGNENMIVPVFFVLMLTAIYLLVIELTGSIPVALMTVFVSLFERLFTDQLKVTPLLDIFFVPCILLAVVSALKSYRKRPMMLLVSFFFLGAAMMIKAWMIGAVFAAVITGYTVFRNPHYIRYLIAGFALVFCIAFLTYFRLLLSGSTPVDVLRVQKWIFWYYSGRHGGFFTVWPLIFANRWYTWWGDVPVISDKNWSLSWPVVSGLGLFAGIRMLLDRTRRAGPAMHLTALSLFAYAVFMSLGQASARYLLPFLPFAYAASAWLVWTVLGKTPLFRRFL